MTDKKMTDSEIVKIKKRLKDIVEENEFEYFHNNTMSWYSEIRLAYMAIKHLQAENDRLKIENKHYAEFEQGCYVTGYKNIKAEAYKEFAERLKQFLLLNREGEMSVISFENIDNLVKEMVGENNA